MIGTEKEFTLPSDQERVLIVGLGNPGKEHTLNRHNIGFLLLDALCSTYGFDPYRLKDEGMVAKGKIGRFSTLALKPLTYMNRSGLAVSSLMRYFKIPLYNIIVIHDDLDLMPGQIKIKQGGGHGGHNGLRSIDAHAGKGYWRLRFGVGHPGDKNLVTHYVLDNFSKGEQAEFAPIVEAITAEFSEFLSEGPGVFLNRLALKKGK